MTRDALLTNLLQILVGLAVLAVCLANLLIGRLHAKHLETYRLMGAPEMYGRKSFTGNSAMGRFIIGRQHVGLNDTYLSALCDTLLGLTVVFGILFLVPFFSIFLNLHY